MNLPSASAVRLWLAANLSTITNSMVAIGTLGPYVPEVAGIGVSPHWVHVLGVLVAGIGALGFKLENPSLALKCFLPWLYPVTPAALEAAKTRLVIPPALVPAPQRPRQDPFSEGSMALPPVKSSEDVTKPGREDSPLRTPPDPPKSAA
jgi:hypothetical protein